MVESNVRPGHPDATERAGPRIRRAPLLVAALLLAATAAFHLTGLTMAAGWLDGERQRIVILLWLTPAVTWFLVAAFWLYHALRGPAPGWPALVLTALVPLVVALPLLFYVSPLHPGGYMLLASSVLAVFGRKPGA